MVKRVYILMQRTERLLAPVVTFLAIYWKYIILGCCIILGVIFYSLPQEVASKRREREKTIKESKKAQKKSEVIIKLQADTIAVQKEVLAQVHQRNQKYGSQDSSLRAKNTPNPEFRTHSGVSRYLSTYRNTPWDTLPH